MSADVNVSVRAAGAFAGSGTVEVKAKTHVWIHWAEIAIEHYRETASSRAKALELSSVPELSHLFSEELGREMRAAMVTLTATAHTLETFYKAVQPHAPAIPQTTLDLWEQNRTGIQAHILETLQLGFDLGSRKAVWGKELKWLYKERNGLVHFREEFKPFEPHPTGTSTSPEQAAYSFEAARKAVTLMLDVLETCVEKARAEHHELAAYANGMRPTIAMLQTRLADAQPSASNIS